MTHRLVALDLRGHGLSDKPHDAYNDSKLWADDVNAVIQSSTWIIPCSPDGRTVRLSSSTTFGTTARTRSAACNSSAGSRSWAVRRPCRSSLLNFSAVVPQFLSTDAETSVRGLEGLLRLCFARKPSPPELYLMLGYNVSVPPYVRQGLFSRSFDNDDLLPKIRKPVLITHGAADAIVKPAAVDQHKAAMPHAQVQLMANMGHAVFWDDAAGFNERLHAFCESL